MLEAMVQIGMSRHSSGVEVLVDGSFFYCARLYWPTARAKWGNIPAPVRQSGRAWAYMKYWDPVEGSLVQLSARGSAPNHLVVGQAAGSFRRCPTKF